MTALGLERSWKGSYRLGRVAKFIQENPAVDVGLLDRGMFVATSRP